MENEIIYFEFNNWEADVYYPDKEPYITWLGNDLNLYFSNEQWVKENNLVVTKSIIDMSVNYYIGATKDWVLKNCPSLLNEDSRFLRFQNLEERNNDILFGYWGTPCLSYSKENIGVHDCYWCDDTQDYVIE